MAHGTDSFSVGPLPSGGGRSVKILRVAVRPIRIVGDPVLHTPTRPVTVFDGALRELVADMYDTMDAADGVGLAANQIGVPLRLFVYDCPDEELRQRRRGVVVNPVLETSERPEGMPDPDDDDEGCLSVPSEQFPTGRAEWARVTGTDADGAPVTVEGRGLLRPLPAARDRPSRRRAVPRPAGRAVPARGPPRGARPRLGRARARLGSGRCSRRRTLPGGPAPENSAFAESELQASAPATV